MREDERRVVGERAVAPANDAKKKNALSLCLDDSQITHSRTDPSL